MSTNPNIIQDLGQTGQVASYAEVEQLVFAFEAVLDRFGIPIQSGSEREGACCSVLEVLSKNQNTHIRDPQEDIRHVFTEVLGIWSFLKKIVRLEGHACFSQFVPHLALLNKGTVVQNKRATVCQEATNKIFELLFALVLLDVSDEVILDHPSSAKGDNPDVLATIEGQCWGFACKTIYGASGKTFYDNLKKGVEQIEAASARDYLLTIVWPVRRYARRDGRGGVVLCLSCRGEAPSGRIGGHGAHGVPHDERIHGRAAVSQLGDLRAAGGYGYDLGTHSGVLAWPANHLPGRVSLQEGRSNVHRLGASWPGAAGSVRPQDRPKSTRLMAALDAVNDRWGAGTLEYASSGFTKAWKMQSHRRSPAYTPNWH
jgi:hypothetical protein